MRAIRQSSKFGKEVRVLLKRGKDIDKLGRILEALVRDDKLPAKNKDHVLIGNWAGYRECHIEPDWLLIYKVEADTLFLARTGTHADLFE